MLTACTMTSASMNVKVEDRENVKPNGMTIRRHGHEFRPLPDLNDVGDQGDVPAAPSTAKVWYLAYFSPMARTCTYAGSFRQAWSASMLGYM
jgi:hypothetical protein